MPPSSDQDDGTGRIDFREEEMRPSIMKLEVVPETREELATRVIVRVVLIAIAVVAIVVAFMAWRNWANAESRAEAVIAYDQSCVAQDAKTAIELLESHGEAGSRFTAARIRMEQAFEEVGEVPAKPFDVNEAPSGARADAAIAETYRLLILNRRTAAAQMISIVRTNSPAALRARVRAAIALGQFKYASDALASAPKSSDSATRIELQSFVGAMVKGAKAPSLEGPHALTGALRGALAHGEHDRISDLADKLASASVTPRQKHWAKLGQAHKQAYAKGGLADLAELRSLQSTRLAWSDIYTLALGESLLLARAPKAALSEFAKLSASAQPWIGSGRLLRARVHANLILGYFVRAEAEISKLGTQPVDHFLRGWVSMTRGRTQAAHRHFGLVGDKDPFYARYGKLAQIDIALTSNRREEAEKTLSALKPDLPRWRAEAEVRRSLLKTEKLVSRFAPLVAGSKPDPADPYALARHADGLPEAQATTLYKQALERLPAMPHANLGLFEIVLQSGNEAKGWLQKMRFDHPHAARAAQAQGLLWLRDGEGARGAAKLGRLMARYGMSDWAELRALRARLFAQSGEYVRAVREYARAAQLADNQVNHFVQILARKSIAHAELGAKGPAEKVLEQIAEKVSEVGRDQLDTKSEALWTAARARHSLVDKKFVAAQLFAKRALKADPDLVEAHMVLVDFAAEKDREDLAALQAAAGAPFPSYRAKRLFTALERER